MLWTFQNAQNYSLTPKTQKMVNFLQKVLNELWDTLYMASCNDPPHDMCEFSDLVFSQIGASKIQKSAVSETLQTLLYSQNSQNR